jgi:hypothetical protein
VDIENIVMNHYGQFDAAFSMCTIVFYVTMWFNHFSNFGGSSRNTSLRGSKSGDLNQERLESGERFEAAIFCVNH